MNRAIVGAGLGPLRLRVDLDERGVRAGLVERDARGERGGGDLAVKRLSSGALRRPWRIAYRREAADAAERLVTARESSAPRLQRRAG
ncbi:hypothetical protein [Sorangium sp. So ce1151]|uniref:hypothetical protein n=1 Tax=Sorangium sp. So ce1151 TaxID=3133332 RepID=UPI003F5FE395